MPRNSTRYPPYYIEEVDPVITPSPSNPWTQPPSAPGGDSLYYDSLITEYIRQLARADVDIESLYDIETSIIECMIRLGYFNNLTDILHRVSEISINLHHYDRNNLTHRFVVLYIGRYLTNVRNFGHFAGLRPSGELCHHQLIHSITYQELNFLFLSHGLNSPTLQEEPMPYERNQQTDPVDFIINGQKVKLRMICHYSARNRYVQTIMLNAFSERGTNQRNVLQIERFEPNNVVLRRHVFQRPIHGFRFVRQCGSSRLIVKEVK